MAENAPDGPPQRKAPPSARPAADYAAIEAALTQHAARTLVPRRICAPQPNRRYPDAARGDHQARDGGAQAAAAAGIGHRAQRARGDERGDRAHAARDRRRSRRRTSSMRISPTPPRSSTTWSRRPRRRPRRFCRRRRKSRRWPGPCARKATRQSSATCSTSAPPTSIPPARSRTSPASAPPRWCRRSASSSSASTP